jgi:hypothetical protein
VTLSCGQAKHLRFSDIREGKPIPSPVCRLNCELKLKMSVRSFCGGIRCPRRKKSDPLDRCLNQLVGKPNREWERFAYFRCRAVCLVPEIITQETRDDAGPCLPIFLGFNGRKSPPESIPRREVNEQPFGGGIELIFVHKTGTPSESRGSAPIIFVILAGWKVPRLPSRKSVSDIEPAAGLSVSCSKHGKLSGGTQRQLRKTRALAGSQKKALPRLIYR